MADAEAHPPYGTYTTCGENELNDRGWMLFSSSGSHRYSRVFRYTHFDREYWEQAKSLARSWTREGCARPTPRCAWSASVRTCSHGRRTEVDFHKLGLPNDSGRRTDSKARVGMIDRFQPRVLIATPSYSSVPRPHLCRRWASTRRRALVRRLLQGGETVLRGSGYALSASRTCGAPRRSSSTDARRRPRTAAATRAPSTRLETSVSCT